MWFQQGLRGSTASKLLWVGNMITLQNGEGLPGLKQLESKNSIDCKFRILYNFLALVYLSNISF